LNYEAVSHVVSEIRANKPIANNWKAKNDADFEHRRNALEDMMLEIRGKYYGKLWKKIYPPLKMVTK